MKAKPKKNAQAITCSVTNGKASVQKRTQNLNSQAHPMNTLRTANTKSW